MSWTRETDDKALVQRLGERLRRIREAKELSLSELSRLSGVPAPTLSRIENNKMSPTFSVLARVMEGMQCDWTNVVSDLSPDDQGPPDVSVVRQGEGAAAEVSGIDYMFLHRNEHAPLQTLIMKVTATDLNAVGGLIGHEGDEFCYVLKGRLALHIKDHPTEILKSGDNALFNSRIPHAYVDDSGKGSEVLIVMTRPLEAARTSTSESQALITRRTGRKESAALPRTARAPRKKVA
ncbi:helix-turn-helix domain-containing protein [Cupriavidus sp. IK-TO18]|uniref:helix-turn-helix domain-containing protein n=1 Tax=Cupriavidus sp. IK-TO18 TaxID=2782182 RepID=UPI00189AC2CC|nr:helix-turn-helix domain-containing protein [Cupriavidus sp. IK-TO18]